jgi:hypothetical protein
MSIIDVLDAATGLPFRPPPAGVQLTLAGVHDATIERWDVLVRGPASVIHVRAAFFPARVEVIVCDAREHDDERTLARLDVGLGSAAKLERLDEPTPEFASEPWTMSGGPVPRPDAFGELAEVIAHALDAAPAGDSALSALAAALSHRLAELADPTLLALARAFDRRVRHAVFALLQADASRRLAQLANVAPAVLTLAASGNESRALELAVTGAPLNDVLDEIARAQNPEVCGPKDALRARQWILRAPASASPALVRGVPDDAVLDDVPRAADAALGYYAVTSALDAQLGALRGTPRARGLMRFVSLHAERIAALDRWPVHLEAVVRRVLETGKSPTRRAKFEAWFIPGPPPRLRDELLSTIATPLGTLTRLTTTAHLLREGIEMRHCVADYAKATLRGECAVYRIDARGERATLALRRRSLLDDKWEIDGLRGFDNAEPSDAARALVKAFAEQHAGRAEFVEGAQP